VKILKYLLLLLTLFSFAFVVFVFTKDGRYTFEEKMSINLDREIVVPYIENNKNWSYWFDFNFPKEQIKTSESVFAWDDNNYKIKKKPLKDSINYLFSFRGIEYSTTLKMKDLNGKTEIFWQGSGLMTFQEKLFYYLPFENSISIQDKLKRSLSHLKAYLTNRYIKHEIVFGKVELYPSQELFLSSFSSSPDSLIINKQTHEKYLDSIFGIKSLKSKKESLIISYSSDWNEILQNYNLGKFVDKDSLFYVSKTKLTTTKPFYAIKILLKGNYKYKKDVYFKLDKHLESIKYMRSNLGFVVEKQLKTTFDNLPENDCLTEFYFPVKPLIEQIAPVSQQNQLASPKPRSNTSQPQNSERAAPVEQIDAPVESQPEESPIEK